MQQVDRGLLDQGVGRAGRGRVVVGPRLEERSCPDLFRLIHDVARETGQEVPADVYLVNEVNAWVTHRGGVMGFGSRRVMGIGLPLLQGVSEQELKAIIAHAKGRWRPLLITAIFTGLRASELRGLRWKDVSAQTGISAATSAPDCSFRASSVGSPDFSSSRSRSA